LVQSIGADHAVDYTREDFTENGQRYDLIFDAVGKLSKSKCADSLSENGRFVTVRSSTKESAAALEEIQRLVASGELKPVIDREFSLDSIVEAHRYVESGHKKGNVIVRVAGP
jgi:NADPH:quinone reductase-like Zn-dependent oxidoreductase